MLNNGLFNDLISNLYKKWKRQQKIKSHAGLVGHVAVKITNFKMLFCQIKNRLSLLQIVTFFLSVSVGCRCSATRLLLHFLQFWSDATCRQNPLEGLRRCCLLDRHDQRGYEIHLQVS